MKLPLHKRISRPIRRVLKAIGNTAGGDNKTGEAIHGVLDLLPIPNQPIGKLIKALFAGDWFQAKIEIGKLTTVRNITAIVLTLAITFNLLTIEDINNFLATFGEIVSLLSKYGIE